MYLFAILDLRCCAEAFSRCSKQGLLSSGGSRVSHCSDSSCCRAQALGLTGFSSCDAWTCLPHGMWNVPRPDIEPMSPALTGKFLTAIPQGTPINSCLCVSVCLFIHSFEGTAIYVMKISELDAMGTRKLKMPWSLPSKTLAGR